MNIIAKKNYYFIFSLLLIIPGIISLFLYGLNVSIDFTGGSRITYIFSQPVSEENTQEVKEVFESVGATGVTTQPSGTTLIVRTPPLTEEQTTNILNQFEKRDLKARQESLEIIGPTIGQETTRKAVIALVLSAILILLYLAWSFRSVPRPTSSWQFGITTVITLIHDVLVLLGVFSLLGHFYNVEVDSLFITALLTVMGFSVHDTIVVFDRIRENLIKGKNTSFANTVNDALIQTMTRSLNTSFTSLLVLLTLLLFGGDSIRWFVVALLVGIATGTYSSIFNAAPLLVAWQEWKNQRRAKS